MWWSWFSFIIGVIVGIPVTLGLMAVVACMFSGVLTDKEDRRH